MIRVINFFPNNPKNQYVIETPKGLIFQSYSTIIAIRPIFTSGNKMILDKYKWDYSKTTTKYRNIFLGERTKETKERIENGFYELKDLN